ncbi:MAG TPA: glutamate--tRNA ligase [Microbacteriaceae bacterium]|nr:glutamate--tRNA ligase [Microbacteriaceae bacterium]
MTADETAPAPLPFTTATGADVKVRFCPSPTGTPHVGMVRTALFNWAYARHHGGKLVFRVEDTDAARDSEESYQQLLDALGWLGIDWDEGVEVGGDAGPYRQSQRGAIYRDIIERLLEAGLLYESFVTAEEMEARNRELGRDPRQGYDNFERDLTEEQRSAYRAEGREPSLRLRVPDRAFTINDLIRGEITFPAGSFTDFVVVRPNGAPLYTFVNPVDDALMGITHVLRGEDILSSTPRQLALYLALIEIGVTDAIPQYAHMPLVLGEGSKKLSKRDPESSLFAHRDRGFIPEGLLNYLALLGWSIAPDRDIFTQDELVAAFDIRDVNPNPARFDQKKADAINGDHIRMLDPEDFARRLIPHLTRAVDGPEELELLRAAAPLIQERITVLSEARDMLDFLFVEEDEFAVQPEALPAAKDLVAYRAVLDAALPALEALASWRTASIEEALRAALLAGEDEGGLGLKPRTAFAPLRAAVSGRRVSPPLFESMELLGRPATLDRIDRLRTQLA